MIPGEVRFGRTTKRPIDMRPITLLLFIFLALGVDFLHGQQPATLTKQQEADIQYLMEEEKMARDVYRVFAGLYGRPSFMHIKESEQIHLELMQELARESGVPIPSTVEMDEEGLFKERGLRKIYDRSVKDGSRSLEAALRASAGIEETDIRDLRVAYENAGDERARDLYQRLERASYNHLRAFTRNLKAIGVTYSPVLLGQEDFDNITGGGGAAAGPSADCPAWPGCCRAKTR